jgi:hypothetical protein
MIIPFYIYILLGILIMYPSMLYLILLFIVYYNFKINNHMISRIGAVVCKKDISSSLLSRDVRTSYCVRSFGGNKKLNKTYIYVSMHSYSKGVPAISSKIVVYVKPFKSVVVYVKPFNNHSPLMPDITIKLLPTSVELAGTVFPAISRVKNPYSGACKVNQ